MAEKCRRCKNEGMICMGRACPHHMPVEVRTYYCEECARTDDEVELYQFDDYYTIKCGDCILKGYKKIKA